MKSRAILFCNLFREFFAKFTAIMFWKFMCQPFVIRRIRLIKYSDKTSERVFSCLYIPALAFWHLIKVSSDRYLFLFSTQFRLLPCSNIIGFDGHISGDYQLFRFDIRTLQ